ncbi:hypothetical protein CWI39_1623p0010 [Hamiltosporidium magnivora]|uniref:t-SNARE coiled-coil homology domain-containing protein n=1 Tax=Hamiltosporidium magnivora TaxID=148818 RepID=A0A4Q9KZZ3_9MICR|nr:hypothetical protein CWI39_1623p0010 [Hamiltosporidium magnivora]
MNRTQDFLSLIDLEKNIEIKKNKKEKFYDSFLKDINILQNKIKKSGRYEEILILDEAYTSLSHKISGLFQVIEIDTSLNEGLHFEGIKKILNNKLQSVQMLLQEKKSTFLSTTITDLEPEKPIIYKRIEDTSQLFLMEEENKKIMESLTTVDYSLKKTRKRIMDIQSIQDIIGLHLYAQDERIDCIIDTTSDTKKNVIGSKSFLDKNKAMGKAIRRIVFIILLCLSFVLLFLHFYH